MGVPRDLTACVVAVLHRRPRKLQRDDTSVVLLACRAVRPVFRPVLGTDDEAANVGVPARATASAATQQLASSWPGLVHADPAIRGAMVCGRAALPHQPPPTRGLARVDALCPCPWRHVAFHLPGMLLSAGWMERTTYGGYAYYFQSAAGPR